MEGQGPGKAREGAEGLGNREKGDRGRGKAGQEGGGQGRPGRREAGGKEGLQSSGCGKQDKPQGFVAPHHETDPQKTAAIRRED